MPAPTDDQAHVDRLEEVWSSTARLGDSLTEADWKAPTECPGWSVQDNLAHVIGIESVILGRAEPELSPPDAEHIKNDVGRSTRCGSRRTATGRAPRCSRSSAR